MKELEWVECNCPSYKGLKSGLEILPCSCKRNKNIWGQLNAPDVICYLGPDVKDGVIRYAGNPFAGNAPMLPHCHIVCAACNKAMGKAITGRSQKDIDRCARLLVKRWNEENA